jgi:hypothetical protein
MSNHAFALTLLVVATTAPSVDGQFNLVRRQLGNHYDVGNIRVFYDTQGAHAVERVDQNANGVPDQVEDVARQSWVAYRLFVDTLEFPDPLHSPRYRQASVIDVNLLSKSTIKLNGIAYDGLQRFGRPLDRPGARAISFDVATSVQPTESITPAHEMFHLIQNGATFFKTRWYTEGMARWSEHALQHGGVGKIKYRGSWPHSAGDRQRLFGQTYDAEFSLWNPLAARADPAGAIPAEQIDPAVRGLTYVTGEPVLKDLELTGWRLMRDVLAALGVADDVAFRELGYSEWSETNQKSSANSPFIYEAIMAAARRHGIETTGR